jgi:hypothetical protein
MKSSKIAATGGRNPRLAYIYDFLQQLAEMADREGERPLAQILRALIPLGRKKRNKDLFYS